MKTITLLLMLTANAFAFVTVELKIYSGAINPTWQLTEEQVEILKDRLEDGVSVPYLSAPGKAGSLGVPVFFIRSYQEKGVPREFYVGSGVIDFGFSSSQFDGTRKFEKFLLETGKRNMSPDTYDWMKSELVDLTLEEVKNK